VKNHHLYLFYQKLGGELSSIEFDSEFANMIRSDPKFSLIQKIHKGYQGFGLPKDFLLFKEDTTPLDCSEGIQLEDSNHAYLPPSPPSSSLPIKMESPSFLGVLQTTTGMKVGREDFPISSTGSVRKMSSLSHLKSNESEGPKGNISRKRKKSEEKYRVSTYRQDLKKALLLSKGEPEVPQEVHPLPVVEKPKKRRKVQKKPAPKVLEEDEFVDIMGDGPDPAEESVNSLSQSDVLIEVCF